jgi:hypothetical protein
MKTHLLNLLISTLFPFALLSQTYFDRTYDFGTIDHPVAFVSDQMGNVIVCGWFEDANHENQKAFALKVNTNGDEIWRISLEDTSRYMALCITESGQIVLAGSKNNHCYLSMVNSESGEEMWTYQEDTSEGFWFGSVNEITDGTDYRLHAAKTTDAAHLIQYDVFDPESGDYIENVNDINHIFNPVFVSGQIAPNQIWFACEGLVISNNYNGFCGLWLFSTIHIAGVDRYSPNKGFVARLFTWGSEYYLGVLTKTLEGDLVYGNAFEIIHRNFNVTGSGIIDADKILTTGTIEGELAVWFIDYELTNMYERIYPSASPRIGLDVLGLPSNDMVIMGTETINTGIETDIFLMKLDSDGLVSTEELTKEESIHIYPNPTSGEIYISNNNPGNVKVNIFNNLGKKVKTLSTTNQYISINELPAGFYVATIDIDGVFIKQEKLIKQ